jgi:hypothetical protein
MSDLPPDYPMDLRTEPFFERNGSTWWISNLGEGISRRWASERGIAVGGIELDDADVDRHDGSLLSAAFEKFQADGGLVGDWERRKGVS